MNRPLLFQDIGEPPVIPGGLDIPSGDDQRADGRRFTRKGGVPVLCPQKYRRDKLAVRETNLLFAEVA